jgi:hypothetical protein
MSSQGMGRRRQGATEPEQRNDRNRSLDREIEAEMELEMRGDLHERGRQPGAHGRRSPHREVKPGIRGDI